ncbi:MAG: Rrf2 family transcriptional regulator [Acidobacteriota bacterium]|nr:Rrf2 family transcriptional regulator [Acidobacteriota bacterium]
MLFSPPCEHALRALIFLAGLPEKKPVSADLISEETGVPRQFLSKIMLEMKHHGLVKTIKGPGGGYFLAKSPGEIVVSDVTDVMNRRLKTTTSCILGLEICMDEHPCPLHTQWKKFKQDVELELNSLTLFELSEKVRDKKAHLQSPSE